ncbi:hypothetical protein Gpo141_00007345 [Globisporangium polare]
MDCYDALQIEGARILSSRVLLRPLKWSVQCKYQLWEGPSPLQLARPHLMIKVRCEERADGGDGVDRLSASLSALAVILTHSYRLNEFPAHKAQFWEPLLRSKLRCLDHKEELTVDEWLWMVEHESFPSVSIYLDCRGKNTMTDAHMEALYKFFTTPPAHGMGAQYDLTTAQCRQISVGLVPDTHKRTAYDVRRIQELLDRVFGSPTRQFAINHLRLSTCAMSAEKLDCVAAFLRRNNLVYKIAHVPLTVSTRPRYGLVTDLDDAADAALLHVIAAAFDTSSAFSSQSTRDDGARGGLRGFFLNETCLGLEHVAAISSALRYGSTIDRLNLRNVLQGVDDAERTQCWRWLAFGIFYPRSKRLGSDNTRLRVNLSRNELPPSDIESFIRTLRDPALELVYHGVASQMRIPSIEGQIAVCRVSQGAKFYAAPQEVSKVVLELQQEADLEVLCQERGWACVVLPGLGFGWVSDDQILEMDYETVDDDSLRVALTFTEIPRTGSSHDQFGTLFQHIGRHLNYLDLSNSVIGSNEPLLDDIFKHCGKLEHLELHSNICNHRTVDQILDELRGDLGSRLLSLNLNCNFISFEGLQRLAVFLADPARRPALQELRLLARSTTLELLELFQKVLHVNKTLRVLELTVPKAELSKRESCREVRALYLSIEKQHQGELLPSSLPLRHKLAFQSVVTHRRVRLDAFLVKSILTFAADQVCRRIYWDNVAAVERKCW